MMLAIRSITVLSLPILMMALAAPASSQEVLGKTKAEWLTSLVKEEKPELRRAAAIALGIIGPGQKDVLPALGKSLVEDKDESVRIQVAGILAGVSPNELRDLLPILADVLKFDKSAGVRAQVVSLIGRLGENAKPALTQLENALADGNASVRSASLDALGRMGPEAKSAVDKMVPLFKDSEASVRLAAAHAIARIGADPNTAVPYLNQLLESDASDDVRREAAKSIALFGVFGAKTALPSLVKVLRTDKEQEVRRQAAIALGKMGYELKGYMKDLLLAAREDKDKTVRLHLIRTMGATLGKALKEYLKELGDWLPVEEDSNVRLAIVQEIGALGADAVEALPALQKAETDISLQVREAVRIVQDQIRKATMKDKKDTKKE